MPRHERGRGRGAADESEERTEVGRRRESGQIEARSGNGLHVLVERGRRERRQIRDAAQIGLVARREDDLVGRRPVPSLSVGPSAFALDHLGLGVHVGALMRGASQWLEREPPDLPEAAGDRVAFRCRQRAPVAVLARAWPRRAGRRSRQLTSAKRGCGWRWTMSTARGARARAISAAISYALWRPPTISTCAPETSSKSTSRRCGPVRRPLGRCCEVRDAGRGDDARACTVAPGGQLRLRRDSSSITSIPACSWNQAA